MKLILRLGVAIAAISFGLSFLFWLMAFSGLNHFDLFMPMSIICLMIPVGIIIIGVIFYALRWAFTEIEPFD